MTQFSLRAFSLEPDEFQTIVEAVRVAEKSLGKISYEMSEKNNPAAPSGVRSLLWRISRRVRSLREQMFAPSGLGMDCQSRIG